MSDSFNKDTVVLDAWTAAGDNYRLVNHGAGPDELLIKRHTGWSSESRCYIHSTLCNRIKSLRDYQDHAADFISDLEEKNDELKARVYEPWTPSFTPPEKDGVYLGISGNGYIGICTFQDQEWHKMFDRSYCVFYKSVPPAQSLAALKRKHYEECAEMCTKRGIKFKRIYENCDDYEGEACWIYQEAFDCAEAIREKAKEGSDD